MHDPTSARNGHFIIYQKIAQVKIEIIFILRSISINTVVTFYFSLLKKIPERSYSTAIHFKNRNHIA